MRIAILLYDGFTALDAVGPYEVLSRVPGVRVQFVAKRPGPVVADSGMLTLVAQSAIGDVPRPEVVLIPGGVSGTFAAACDEQVLQWVRRAHEGSRLTTSVCSGALILGAAGILQGKRATTHWLVRKRLSRYGAAYSSERVVEEGKIVTAQGVSAGIDLGLYLAGRLAGPVTAEAIQLVLEYDPQPPFDSGSLQKASDAVRRRARRMLVRQFLWEKGQDLLRALATHRRQT